MKGLSLLGMRRSKAWRRPDASTTSAITSLSGPEWLQVPYMQTYIYIHTCIHTYIHSYMHSYMHAYIHTYKHTYIHTYIHTSIQTYKPEDDGLVGGGEGAQGLLEHQAAQILRSVTTDTYHD
jgi:hypothetical protein